MLCWFFLVNQVLVIQTIKSFTELTRFTINLTTEAREFKCM